MQTMSSEINEFARRRVKSTVFAFSESLVGDADHHAEQQQYGNPDKNVYQLRILFSQPPLFDVSSLRAAMQQLSGLKASVNALADGAAR
jgi:hypothetical protein